VVSVVCGFNPSYKQIKLNIKLKVFVKNIKNCVSTVVMAVVLVFLMFACTTHTMEHTEAVADRATVPRLRASEVTTVISDSGVTRYRIYTQKWDMYDKAIPPYQEFPQGIYLEKFDSLLNIDANIESDYAKYLDNEHLWELRGNVRLMNIKGELFESERIFWNERSEKVYSDTLVKITQTNRIINAVGFESNQQMTKYTFRQTTGIIPMEDK
jgi:LPS export ABC transporter protein LptC